MNVQQLGLQSSHTNSLSEPSNPDYAYGLLRHPFTPATGPPAVVQAGYAAAQACFYPTIDHCHFSSGQGNTYAAVWGHPYPQSRFSLQPDGSYAHDITGQGENFGVSGLQYEQPQSQPQFCIRSDVADHFANAQTMPYISTSSMQIASHQQPAFEDKLWQDPSAFASMQNMQQNDVGQAPTFYTEHALSCPPHAASAPSVPLSVQPSVIEAEARPSLAKQATAPVQHERDQANCTIPSSSHAQVKRGSCTLPWCSCARCACANAWFMLDMQHPES